MSLTTLWLLTAIPEIANWLGAISAVLAAFVFLCVGGFLTYGNDVIEGRRVENKCLKIALILFLITSFTATILPSKSDLYFILGGYYVTNNEEIKKLPSNMAGAANSFLEDIRKETKKTIDNSSKDMLLLPNKGSN